MQTNSEADPYGEEDWNNINEDSIKKELMGIVLNRHVEFRTLSSEGPLYNKKVIKGVVKDVIVKWIPHHLEYWILFLINGKNHYVYPNLDIKVKENLMEHIDIDPYGEEKWDEE
jgi:hypothetical protein